MTKVSSTYSILVQVNFESLYFKKRRRAYQYTTILNGVLLNPPTTDPLTNDQPTTNHLPADPSTHRPKIHRPTDKILFQRLDNQKIFILQITNTAGKMYNYTSVYVNLKNTYGEIKICLLLCLLN